MGNSKIENCGSSVFFSYSLRCYFKIIYYLFNNYLFLGTGRVYNALTHHCVSKLEGHEGEISKVCYSLQIVNKY